MDILIVDDSRAMRMIVLRALRQAGYGDHNILQASDGVEAWEIIEQNDPDIVLSDWNMPNMNGFDLLRKMRQENFDSYFGFITSEGSPNVVQQMEDAGADFLLTKPFTPESLRESLEELMQEEEAEA